MTRDLVFLDTETLGLHPDAPIWEFAAIRRFSQPVKGRDVTYSEKTGSELSMHFTIQHENADHWLADLPDQFIVDYDARYIHEKAWCEALAAQAIWELTHETVIIGSNPGFDLERLTKLLQRNHFEPSWHYHPLDISSINMGYLAGRDELEGVDLKSDALARAVGVDANNYERHTAMGDVLWTRAQWDNTVGTWVRHA